MTTSAYIHIPFCRSKCGYCSFVSQVCEKSQADETLEKYTQSLLNDIDNYYKDEPLKTLYIGGGTPSLLDISQVLRIIQPFAFENGAEITFEINPETVNVEYLENLRLTGINRISIGVQSFDDEILKKIGRIHDSKTAAQAVLAAKKAGFKNISIDLIYGLPTQTKEGFIKDLKTALELGITHVSLYGLKIEEGTKFHEKYSQNKELAAKEIPDEDIQADCYLEAAEILESQGFLHYEISNFAKPGFESRHNLNYWDDCEYYGFGAAAHGYIGGVRYSNYCDLETYHKKFDQKEFLQALNKQERLEETIFLGLRKGCGLDVSEINEKFSINFETFYAEPIRKYTQSGHLIKTENGYRFSNEGFLLSNIILAEFI